MGQAGVTDLRIAEIQVSQHGHSLLSVLLLIFNISQLDADRGFFAIKGLYPDVSGWCSRGSTGIVKRCAGLKQWFNREPAGAMGRVPGSTAKGDPGHRPSRGFSPDPRGQ